MTRFPLALLLVLLATSTNAQGSLRGRQLEATDAPTDMTTDMGTTMSPTDMDSMSPTEGASTESPTDGASSESPSTESPTEDASSMSPSTEAPSDSMSPSTDSPTDAATMNTEEPTDAETGAPTEAATGAPTSAPTDSKGKPNLPDQANDNADNGNGNGPKDEPGSKKDDDIRMFDGDDVFNVDTVVTLTYFDGQGGELSDGYLEIFNERMAQLEAGQFKADEKFGDIFAKYEVTGLKQSWNEDTNTLTLTFTSRVELVAGGGEGQTPHTVAKVMARPDFKKHIHTLMEYKIGGIHKLVFTNTGTGERR